MVEMPWPTDKRVNTLGVCVFTELDTLYKNLPRERVSTILHSLLTSERESVVFTHTNTFTHTHSWNAKKC